MTSTPYEVRDQAVKSLLSAYKSNFTALRNGQISEFNIKFQRKKGAQCIAILKKCFKKNGICPKFGLGILKGYETLPSELDHDSKLLKENDKYYLLVPELIQQENVKPMDSIVAIDPGVRTFATCYDAKQASIFEWGKCDIGRQYRLALQIDKLTSLRAQKDVRTKRRMALNKVIRRKRTKIKSLTQEMHRQFTKWLCENYQLIILPKFDVKNMTKRSGRRLQKESVRKMLTWNHYGFRQYLLHKAREYGTLVYLCDERYTTRTCSECQTVNDRVGSSKVFHCVNPICNYVADRDFNGSRNIFLKGMSELRQLVV